MNINKFIAILAFAMTSILNAGEYNIIPLPTQLKKVLGEFLITDKTLLIFEESLQK